MMSKEDWEKKWPQLAYNPSLLMKQNEGFIRMSEEETSIYLKNMRATEVKQAVEYQKYKREFIQTPEQEIYNNDSDF